MPKVHEVSAKFKNSPVGWRWIGGYTVEVMPGKSIPKDFDGTLRITVPVGLIESKAGRVRFSDGTNSFFLKDKKIKTIYDLDGNPI